MRVSIITATWNRADILHIPIQSVIDQTYEDWDLWVMDDASTDNTEEVVMAFRDPRIHYVKLEKQPYYTVVRNKGIEMSDGELLAFRDSDGAWEPTFLEKLVGPHSSDDVAVTYCGRKNFLEVPLTKITSREISNYDFLPVFPPVYSGRESLSNIIDVGDMIIKRSVFKKDDTNPLWGKVPFTGFSEEKDQPGYCSDAKLIDTIERYNPHMRFVRIPELLHLYFYKHDGKVENMTDTKLRAREEGKLDPELEAEWYF